MDFDTKTIALCSFRAFALSYSSRDHIAVLWLVSSRPTMPAKCIRQISTPSPTLPILLHSIEVVMFGGDFELSLMLIGGLLITILYYNRRLMGTLVSCLTSLTLRARPACFHDLKS